MSNDTHHRPTVCTTDLEALAFNYRSCRRFFGSDTAIMAMVKANAYGHGSVRCAQRLVDEGIEWFGVATLEEALELRLAGIDRRILLLGGIWPGQEDVVISHNITPAILSSEMASRLDSAAIRSGRIATIHAKIDTGMGRVGIRPDEVDEFIKTLRVSGSLKLEGIMTHFAAADDPRENDYTQLQIELFDQIVSRLSEFEPEIIDLANSPGAVTFSASRRGFVRLGGILYGLVGDMLPTGIEAPELRPVMSMTSVIGQLKRISIGETLGYGRTFTAERDSIVATVPVGYADGLPRLLSNKGEMLVGGVCVPIIGRVSMDWTIIDVTCVPGVSVGDKVVIIGMDGENSVSAVDIARKCDTISYEITCGIGSRVKRTYG